MYDDLIKRLRASVDGRNEKCDGCPYEEDYPCCVDCLDKMHKQAADAIEELSKRVRPVVRGKWISDHLGKNIGEEVRLDKDGCPVTSCHCSVCGEWLTASDEYAVTGRFCPNCGADMRGETNGT